MVMFLIFLVLAWSVEDVLVRIMLAKMVPSKIQSFTETLRGGVCKIACIVASITVPMLSTWLHWWAVGILILILLLLVWFIMRRKYFINPQEITFVEDNQVMEKAERLL